MTGPSTCIVGAKNYVFLSEIEKAMLQGSSEAALADEATIDEQVGKSAHVQITC